MRKLTMMAAVAAALVMALPAISKADKILMVTESSGTYGPADFPSTFGGGCAVTGCVGLLTGLTCAGGAFADAEAISPVLQTFYFIHFSIW